MLLSSWRYTILDETVLLTVTRDITLRKRAEDALRESEEKLRLVVSNVPLVLFNINRAGIFTLSEGLGLKPLGVEPGQVVGKSVYDVYRDVPEIIRVVDLTFAGEPQHHEVNIFGAWYEAWYNPVKTQGEVTGLIGVAADITDEKRAQEERRQFYRKTIEAATEGKLIITDRRTTLEMAGPPIAQQQIVKGDDLAKVRRMIADVAQSEGISESKTFDLVFGAGEATANVIKHAGIGEVSVHSVTNGLLIIVSDHGPGIPALSLPEVALKRGYTTAISLGMGYKAMISIADHVYLATGPTGTTVAIEMLLKQEHKTSLLDSLPDTWA